MVCVHGVAAAPVLCDDERVVEGKELGFQKEFVPSSHILSSMSIEAAIFRS